MYRYGAELLTGQGGVSGRLKEPVPHPVYNGMNATKDNIIELLNGVERSGIDNVVRFLTESNFFTAQCHRHHKFRGGLAQHSLEVYENMSALPGVPHESAVLVGLLHDVCTSYHKGCRHIGGHGKRSVRILKEVCHLELTPEEEEAILLHMHPQEGFHKRLCRAVTLSDNISAMFGAKEPSEATV